MQKRRCGVELELFLTKNASPISRNDWLELIKRAEAQNLPIIYDTYSRFPLGASLETGAFVLDNNCAVLELISEPADHLNEVVSNLHCLLGFFDEHAPDYEMHWTAHFEDESEDAYWERTISNALYGAVRQQNWPHWKLMNSMAFQPAIDVRSDEVVSVLRVLYLTAPLFIYMFEGQNNRTDLFAPRMKKWVEAIPANQKRIGLPEREIQSLEDYVDNLLALPALIANKGAAETPLIFFDQKERETSVLDVMFGEVEGQNVIRVPSLETMKHEQVETRPVQVSGDLSSFYSLSLPFWHVRLVFQCHDEIAVSDKQQLVAAIQNSEKLFVELRHLGTPKDMETLKHRFEMFFKLVEQSTALDHEISSCLNWEEAKAENRQVIEQGELGEASRKIFKILKDKSILQEDLQ